MDEAQQLVDEYGDMAWSKYMQNKFIIYLFCIISIAIFLPSIKLSKNMDILDIIILVIMIDCASNIIVEPLVMMYKINKLLKNKKDIE